MRATIAEKLKVPEDPWKSTSFTKVQYKHLEDMTINSILDTCDVKKVEKPFIDADLPGGADIVKIMPKRRGKTE